jgi:hypothetical protein
MDENYTVVDLVGFTFEYFGNNYTQVSISTNGYVCLGPNYQCSSNTRPLIHNILVGLNSDLDTTREGSGQIYYKKLDPNSLDFASTKIGLNLFNPKFEPQQIFMITYDNVLPLDSNSISITSFQIFLSTDSVKSFVTLKFKTCPSIQELYSSSGLNYRKFDGKLQEVIVPNGKQCTESNVGQEGVWVSDVSTKGKLLVFILFQVP